MLMGCVLDRLSGFQGLARTASGAVSFTLSCHRPVVHLVQAGPLQLILRLQTLRPPLWSSVGSALSVLTATPAMPQSLFLPVSPISGLLMLKQPPTTQPLLLPPFQHRSQPLPKAVPHLHTNSRSSALTRSVWTLPLTLSFP